MEQQNDQLSGWAIVEIMGHQKYVGEVSTLQLGGTSMLRIDVPAIEEHAAFSKIFGWGSVFCLTPVQEDVARGLAGRYRASPFQTYDLPQEWQDAVRASRQQRLPAAVVDEDADDIDYDDESI